MAITIMLAIATLFADIFQCTPVALAYDKTIKGGHCIRQGPFFYATSATNIFTDVLVVFLPFGILWDLKMPRKQKVAVGCILSLAGL